MALPERKPESERPDPPGKKTARERAESRWGVAIHRLLGAVRSLFERMGILDGVHTGVVDKLFGNSPEGQSDEDKEAEDELGRFLFIGVPDDEGGYSTKMWIHEDAVEGFLAAGWSKISTEENDMPLNEKDWEGINKVLDRKFEQHKPTIENISFTGKQMLVLAGSIVSAAILIGGSILGGTLFLNNSLNKMASRIDVLDTKIDERLPSKLPEAATSTDTGSSTPPTAKDGPATP